MPRLERKYRTLLETAPDALIVVNQRGEIVLLNVQAEKQFGYLRDELLGQPVANIIPDGVPAQIAQRPGTGEGALAPHRSTGIELKGRRKDGSPFPIEFSLNPVQSTEGMLVTLAVRDITMRKRAEAHLLQKMEELNRAQVTLDCIGDAVVCTDLRANITFLNSVAEKMTGWPLNEAAGRPLAEILRISEHRNRDSTRNTTELAILHDCAELVPTKCTLVRRDGCEIEIENSVAPVHDAQGQATGAVVVFRDTSAADAMARKIAYAADHDFLTDLPNARLLKRRIRKAIDSAQSLGRRVAVLFLDLDGFKYINDSLGHPVGDKLLQSVAGRLVDCVRSHDTVSRQGGDEFVVLLPDVQSMEEPANLARRLLHAVSGVHSADRHNLHVTTSIGVSMFPDDGRDPETLIKNADAAMYQAKENGRQGVQFFEPAMNARAVERQFIEEGLRCALERDELALHYQPKVDLRTGAITGAEALIRWVHPERGMIWPSQFIGIAEECGLILPIGKWVLREACAQARSWTQAGFPEVTVAVNVSPLEFRGDSFVSSLFAMLGETRLAPSSLELELTESVFMERVESAASILRILRQTGVRVAVDDFGTGYSCLSYLRKLPLDALKIDQSFVREIATRGDDAAIVTAVINMARSLELRVVAEGVETHEELEALRTHGCDHAQGYYLARPVPPEQFIELLRSGADGHQSL